MDNCPKDPNIKTLKNLDQEFERINKVNSEGKRVFADSYVQTAHMIKKCVMIEKKNAGMSKANTMFQRGIMSSDDYNYSNINQYILVDENEDDRKKTLDLTTK